MTLQRLIHFERQLYQNGPAAEKHNVCFNVVKYRRKRDSRQRKIKKFDNYNKKRIEDGKEPVSLRDVVKLSSFRLSREERRQEKWARISWLGESPNAKAKAKLEFKLKLKLS